MNLRWGLLLLLPTLALAEGEIGFSLGNPAGGNFQLGLWQNMVIRASGGYWGATTRGFQGELGVPFDKEGKFWQYVGAVYTRGEMEGRSWQGIGPGYGFNASGFQLMTGVTFGKGDYSSPQLILQLGYSFISRDPPKSTFTKTRQPRGNR